MLKKLIFSAWSRRARRTPPKNVEDLNEAALETWRKGDLIAAEGKFRTIVDAFPSYAPAYGNLGMVLADQFRFDEGVAVLKAGLQRGPNHAGLHTNLGLLLLRARMLPEAIEHLQRALTLDPELKEANQILVGALLDACDWGALAPIVDRLRERIESDPLETWTNAITPFSSLLLPLDASFQQKVAHAYAMRVRRNIQSLRRPMQERRSPDNPKLRLGYFSCDFRDHPICHLASGLFGLHDRQRFDVYAYSYGPDDKSEYRKRVQQGCDHFRDLSQQSTQQIADTISADGIDILIDLSGYSSDARPEVLALRPAPVQINYLGYPGTLGAEFADYIIADDYAVPPDLRQWISESVIALRGCFLPNIRHESTSFPAYSRIEAGLPETGAVFCCFAQPSRIEPVIFSAWMEILRRTPDSILWLRQHNPTASANLSRAVQSSGIDPARLVFAGKLPSKTLHFSRLALADMALDTHLYNGHTTTSDALWAGIPVLTCPGRTFASRVAGSILHHAGLDELICPDLAAYISKACHFATDPSALEPMRKKIQSHRSSPGSADQAQYVRLLEEAFAEMWSEQMTKPRQQ